MAPDTDGGYLDLDARLSDSLTGSLTATGSATLGWRRDGLRLGATAGLTAIDGDLGYYAGLGLRYEW